MILSICTDMTALRKIEGITPDKDGNASLKDRILSKCGAYVLKNGNQSVVCLTDVEGFEQLAKLPYIITTTYEAMYGHRGEQTGLGPEYPVTPKPRWVEKIVEVGKDENGWPTYEDQGEFVQDPDCMVQDPLYEAPVPATNEGIKALAIYKTITDKKIFAVPGGYSMDHLL